MSNPSRIDHRAPRSDIHPNLSAIDSFYEHSLTFEHDHDLVAPGMAFPAQPIRRCCFDHDEAPGSSARAVIGDALLERRAIKPEALKRNRRRIGAFDKANRNRRLA